MGDDEREVLLAAEEEALRVLAAANAEAGRIAGEAEEEAIELLLQHQQSAEDLLKEAKDAASKDGGSDEDRNAILEAHREAGELLAAAEQEVAARLLANRTDAAVDVLMAGHRQAAAILLGAWMRVTEGRSSDR